jgi:hypothetical protein
VQGSSIQQNNKEPFIRANHLVTWRTKQNKYAPKMKNDETISLVSNAAACIALLECRGRRQTLGRVAAEEPVQNQNLQSVP